MIIKDIFQYKQFFHNDNPSIKVKNRAQDNLIYAKKRNYGIDILRIISMIKIIILHINYFPGQLKLNISSPKYKHIWLLEIFSYPAVNCFGLISGIVGYKKYKFSNLIYLWILVSFYSVSISFYLFFFYKKISLQHLILSFFPILIKRHWYVNAYFLLYLLLPFINNGIMQLHQNIYRNLVIFILCFYLSHYTITRLIGIQNNTFLIDGRSSMWLLLLYIIGGYMGKYKTNYIKKKGIFLFLITYIFSSFFSWEIFSKHLKSNKKANQTFISNISPTTVFQALSLIMIFSNLEIENKLLIKIISFLMPLNFSVQLIHARLFNSKINIIKIFFNWIINFNNNGLFLKIYGAGIITYIICIIFDYLRLLLFKFLNVRKFCLLIERKIPELIDKISK